MHRRNKYALKEGKEASILKETVQYLFHTKIKTQKIQTIFTNNNIFCPLIKNPNYAYTMLLCEKKSLRIAIHFRFVSLHEDNAFLFAISSINSAILT